jgi:hypothetical protein
MGTPKPNPGKKGLNMWIFPIAQQCLAPQTMGRTHIFIHNTIKEQVSITPQTLYVKPIKS